MTRAKAIPETITIHVPFRIVKRGGRKEMIMPPDASAECPRSENTLIKALARAFRWKRMLDSGAFTSVTEIAAQEHLSFTYVSRVVRLSLLAPDIVGAILAERQPPTMMLADLLDKVPLDWEMQCALWLTAPIRPDRS